MASFDPSIISQIPDMAPNPMGAKKEAYSLAGLMDQQQLGSLQLKQAQEDQHQKETARNILSQPGVDYSTPEGVTKTAEKLSRAGAGDYAMKFMKQAQDYQTGAIQQKVAALQLADEQQGSIVGALEPVVRQLETMEKSGAPPAALNASAKALMGPAAQQLMEARPDLKPMIQKMIADPNKISYQQLKAWEVSSKQGRDALKSRLAEYQQQTRDKQEADREKRTEGLLSNYASLAKSRNEKSEAQKGGIVPPEDLEVTVQQYLAGDRQAVVGLGSSRTQAGMQNWANFRKELRKQATEEAKSKGYTGADTGRYIANQMAAFEAQKAEERAVGTRQAQIETAATEFYSKDEKTGKERGVSQVALRASKEVPRGDWMPANELLQKWDKMNSNTPLFKFGQALDSAVNVYARAITPVGVPTEAAKARAIEKLSTAMGPDAVQGVFDIMNQEIQEAQYAPTVVRDRITSSFMDASKPRASSESSPTQSSKPISMGGKNYVRGPNGKWIEQ